VAARDVVNGWSKAVDSQYVTDPNILCLPRDWNEYEIEDEDGNLIDIVDGIEIFLKLLSKTCPEVMKVAISWDGFDSEGKTPFHLTLDADVNRDEPRSQLLKRRIDHHKANPLRPELASHLFTDEKKYYWTDQVKKEANAPWQPGQLVSFKLKPWSKENTAERQRTRSKPTPADGHDPLGPLSHFPAAPSATAGGASRTSGSLGTSDSSSSPSTDADAEIDQTQR
jgi:hypothetical protein